VRWLRTREGERRLRPRRGRCRESACGATHVLLPDVCLARRQAAVEVIGEALLSTEGYRRVAERLGVPAETVRDWRRRFRLCAAAIAAHYEHVSFVFCGYAFRPGKTANKRRRETFTGFLPAASPGKLSEMSRRAASCQLHRRVNLTLDDLARGVNPVLRGWLAYYAAFYPDAVIPLCHRIDLHLVRWARWKYKRLQRSGRRARTWLRGVRLREPELFVHWRYCTPPR
jgi:hypothetical protein